MTIIKDKTVLVQALKLARGCYQRGILNGNNNLSGSDLRGRARSYIGKYRRSSQNLIERCQEAGLAVAEQTSDHNRRDLVIG